MLHVTFMFKAFVFLAFVGYIFQVHSVTANTSPRRQQPASPRQAAAAEARVKKIEKAFNQAKLDRSPTSRRQHVAEENRPKYDDHRNQAHKFEGVVKLADLSLSRKLPKKAKPEEILEHNNQKYCAAQVKVEGNFLQDHHTRAANDLLPNHLRDENHMAHILQQQQAAHEHVQNYLRQERLRQSSG